jgi:hypothetical protein
VPVGQVMTKFVPKHEVLHDILIFRHASEVTAKSFIMTVHLSAWNNLAYTTKYTDLKFKYRKKKLL